MLIVAADLKVARRRTLPAADKGEDGEPHL
jgi:hypothetical protein